MPTLMIALCLLFVPLCADDGGYYDFLNLGMVESEVIPCSEISEAGSCSYMCQYGFDCVGGSVEGPLAGTFYCQWSGGYFADVCAGIGVWRYSPFEPHWMIIYEPCNCQPRY